MRLFGRSLFTVAILALGALSGAAQEPQPAPGNLEGYSGQLGQLTFTVTGSVEGDVYGDGIYTTDSPLGTAAVHAGVVTPGATQAVRIELLGPQPSFKAATRNGIVSYEYGPWDNSFRFVDTTVAQKPLKLPGPPVADPGTLMSFAAEPDTLVSFNIVGADGGAVYGDGVYTGDSVIARAAVHAGIVAPGQSAAVTIRVLGPQESFAGSERNGVLTLPWGRFELAFKFVELRATQ